MSKNETGKSENGKVTYRIESERFLVLERAFNAPPELVFEMFTKTEHLKHWWGPKGFELPYCKVDFRVGGEWHYCMKCVDKNMGQYFGMESWGKAVYSEIAAPNKLSFTDYFSDKDGKVNERLPSSKSTNEFVAMPGNKTKLVTRGEYVSAEALRQVMGMGMLEGISSTWDRLDERLKEFL